MKPENPPSFIVATECQKSAWDNGWRVALETTDGWMLHASHDAPGQIGLAAASPQGPWFLAVDHAGVAKELGTTVDLPGPGLARFAYPTATELYRAVSRAYDLAKALPNDPLQKFKQRTRSMPTSTEAERLVVQRVGQDLFRDALMRFWKGRCPLTGISDPALLRASHMKPWAECENDAERLDVYNGLLLSALWDAAFDRHLVTFGEDGWPQFSPRLTAKARERLEHELDAPISLSEGHMKYLAVHRKTFALSVS
ncbi:HNH endonuclease [Ruegeria intermedia]|uniref:HNH endonuclease n=1 Tax=Ruegeria intermedia TaxID=996115 RepID=A0A1M4Y5G5_9RHOB|nr:HNH endonuclease signature motif containing protein [Ruegeria intermedia]SHF01067.1 HNH endonuclease [Ruegeria intermedia]